MRRSKDALALPLQRTKVGLLRRRSAGTIRTVKKKNRLQCDLITISNIKERTPFRLSRNRGLESRWTLSGRSVGSPGPNLEGRVDWK